MNRYRDKETGAIVWAVQFDPTNKPWPACVKSWDDHPVRPRDMSFGYIEVDDKRLSVLFHDWIVTDEAGNISLYQDADFQAQFEPVQATTFNTSQSQQALDETKVATISEERIRQIIQEEIEQFRKRQFSWLRMNGPQLPPYEVK